jgi:NAD+ kinase
MKTHFVASAKPGAQMALRQLIECYGQNDIESATHIVTVGGDGTILKVLHALWPSKCTPIFAMRLPESVAALGNQFSLSNLRERLGAARRIDIWPIQAEIRHLDGSVSTILGINEIVLSRARLQVSKLNVRTLHSERWKRAIADGVLVATPIGSTGYNRSVGGATLPWDSHLLALTGIAVRNCSEWCNTVVDDQAVIENLVQVRGIGPWTAQMLLIFTLGRPDVMPAADLGVQKGVQAVYRMRKLPGPEQVLRRTGHLAPFRSAASWYFWRAADTQLMS